MGKKSIAESELLNVVGACFSLVLWLTLCSPVRIQASKSTSHTNLQCFLLLLRLYPTLHVFYASLLCFVFWIESKHRIALICILRASP